MRDWIGDRLFRLGAWLMAVGLWVGEEDSFEECESTIAEMVLIGSQALCLGAQVRVSKPTMPGVAGLDGSRSYMRGDLH